MVSGTRKQVWPNDVWKKMENQVLVFPVLFTHVCESKMKKKKRDPKLLGPPAGGWDVVQPQEN